MTTPLAVYAAQPERSRGRRHAEPPPTGRTEFQRDRDRIVHAKAFRRLEYKTQVFVNHEGDLFRTRLTHSIEVAQISRSVARNLGLNEDLIEAIALAHDLGHTPFGHAGQDALDDCLRQRVPESQGFEHNLQSLRVVDQLEERYGAFDGLNLCFETREGILKHCSRARAAQLGDVGQRFLDGTQPTLEAQLTNLCDEIAYNNHDIDDGLRSGLIQLEQLQEVAIFAEHWRRAAAEYPGIPERRLTSETVRRMINTLIVDLTQATAARIAEHRPDSPDAVRAAPVLATFSAPIQQQSRQLKAFLRDNLYRHYQVLRMASKARRIVTELFNAFLDDPALLPPRYRQRAQQASPRAQARAIADYIAGMTDRYAMLEHRRLFDMATRHVL